MCPHVPQEESMAAKVLDELAIRAAQGDVDEFTLSRLEKSAATSRDVDWINYLYVMGAISALRQDKDAVRKYYTQALDANGGTFKTRFNFAQSLALTGQYCDAFAQAKAALEILPTSGQAADLLESISARMIEEMWKDMDNDSDQDLTRMCMMNFAGGVR
jgi:tetratricopeptide (TPR) repeat protein